MCRYKIVQTASPQCRFYRSQSNRQLMHAAAISGIFDSIYDEFDRLTKKKKRREMNGDFLKIVAKCNFSRGKSAMQCHLLRFRLKHRRE